MSTHHNCCSFLFLLSTRNYPSPFPPHYFFEMENIGQTNKRKHVFSNMSELENGTGQNSNRIPESQNSQIPVSMNNNFNETNHQPLSMIPPRPNHFSFFDHGIAQSNQGQVPLFNQGIPNFHQTHLPPHTTPVSPNPNLLPGLDLGNTDFNHQNFTQKIPSAISDPPNTLFNMGTSVPNADNVATVNRRGRPLGSRNKPKILVYPNEELSTPLVVLEFPPNCEIISWLLRYARGRNISLAVVGGFGSISEVVLKPVGAQQLSRAYRDGIMVMNSMSGTYIYSPAEPSPSHSFFNVKATRNHGEIIGGALKIVTGGHVVLKVSFYPQNQII